jgi:ribosome-binding factor A
MAGKRAARLNEQFRREITGILRTQVRDPRIGVPTVTAVEVTPDLWSARVFVRPDPSLLHAGGEAADADPEGDSGPGEAAAGGAGDHASGAPGSSTSAPGHVGQNHTGAAPVSASDPDAVARDLLQGLQAAAPFIRRELSGTLSLRRIPELRFKVDRSIEHAARIHALLAEVLPGDAPGDAGEPDEETPDESPDSSAGEAPSR